MITQIPNTKNTSLDSGLSKQSIPAGLVNKLAELFSVNGSLKGIFNGEVLPFKDLPHIIKMYFSTLYDKARHKNIDCEIILVTHFKCFTYESEVEQYIKCNFGGFDNSPDFEINQNPKKEYWNCGHRGKCIAEGIVCRPNCIHDNDLQPREIEIIKHIAEGKPSKEIAQDLKISITTVRTHEQNIHQKLKCNTRGEIIKFAFKNNIIL